jgi:hypothetical protein
MTDQIIEQEPIIDIVPLIDEETPNHTQLDLEPKPEATVDTDKELRDESVMWIAYREPNMTKRMNYLIHRLSSGLTTKLHAYGLAIGTAVWMSTTIRQQLSGVE